MRRPLASGLPRLFLTLMGLAPGATGVEVVMHDLSISATTLPTAYDFTVDNGTTTTAGSDAMAWHGGLRIGYLNDLGAPGREVVPVVGAEVQAAVGDLDPGRVTHGSVGVVAGVAWGVTDRFAIMLLGTAAIGGGSIALESQAGADAVDARGIVTAYGGRLALRQELNRHWLVGIDADWSQERMRFSGDQDITLDTHGFSAALVAIWRISYIPHRLE